MSPTEETEEDFERAWLMLADIYIGVRATTLPVFVPPYRRLL